MRCTFLVMGSFVLLRVIEIVFRYFSLGEPTDASLLFSRSINFDLLFIILATATWLPILFLINFLPQKIAYLLLRTLALLLVFANAGLTHYYLSTGSLLTGQVFSFSIADIANIVLGEWSISRIPAWLISLSSIGLGYWFLFHWEAESKKRTRRIGITSYLLLLIVAFFNTGHTFKEARYFNNYSKYAQGNCKITYLLRSCWASAKQKEEFQIITKEALKKQSNKYSRAHPEFTFIDPAYPFLHSTDTSNVLGPYFKITDSSPNLIIIISESLSSVLSGRNTKWGSLTPFTDSLMRSGLSWTNFFSNAQKSYGALPNILSSAPQGTNERGIINTEQEYPAHRKYPIHNGLLQLLGANGYTRNYYYGGWGYFDNVGYYLKEQGIDNFVSEDAFDKSKYKKMQAMPGQVAWGYNDKQLYQQALDLFSKHTAKEPYLSVFQTISCHSPYDLAEAAYFERDYLIKKLDSLKISPKILEELDAHSIACTFFADDALRDFFEAMKGKSGFENTIFIITGDHSLGLQNDDDPLRNFHIPLIIWSPLISRTADFKGLCSHVDILPTLTNLLASQKHFLKPASNAWIGRGLDTSTVFRSHNAFPLSLYAMDLPSYVYKDCVIQGESVYRIKEFGKWELIKEQNLSDSLIRISNTFRYLNNFVCSQDRIQREPMSSKP